MASSRRAAPSAADGGKETPGPQRFVGDDVIIDDDDGCCCADSIASSTRRDAQFPFRVARTNSPVSFLAMYGRRPADCISSRSCCSSWFLSS